MRFVYFISETGSAGPIKVGVSANPHKRLRALQTSNYRHLEIVGIIPETDEFNERTIHASLDTWHERGEWYERQAALDALAILSQQEDAMLAHALRNLRKKETHAHS